MKLFSFKWIKNIKCFCFPSLLIVQAQVLSLFLVVSTILKAIILLFCKKFEYFPLLCLRSTNNFIISFRSFSILQSVGLILFVFVQFYKFCTNLLRFCLNLQIFAQNTFVFFDFKQSRPWFISRVTGNLKRRGLDSVG